MWSPKRQEGPTKIVGPAYTVKYVRNNHGTDPTLKGHYVSLVIFLSHSLPSLVDVAYPFHNSDQSVSISKI